ncbi:MAG: endonuclease III [Chitinophagales bacterium]
MNAGKKRTQDILNILEQEFPQARTRLNFTTTFELLVATILSAQSTDEQVNRVTARLFSRYNTPEEFAGLEPTELEDMVKGCGLYRNKAKSIIEASRMIMEHYGGEVPSDLDELIKLPGVGRKTANVVRSVGFGLPGLAVDTHVQRVARRLGLASSENPNQTEQELKSLIPQSRWGKAHHLFIWHGREYCKALKPRCNNCPLSPLCRAIPN